MPAPGSCRAKAGSPDNGRPTGCSHRGRVSARHAPVAVLPRLLVGVRHSSWCSNDSGASHQLPVPPIRAVRVVGRAPDEQCRHRRDHVGRVGDHRPAARRPALPDCEDQQATLSGGQRCCGGLVAVRGDDQQRWLASCKSVASTVAVRNTKGAATNGVQRVGRHQATASEPADKYARDMGGISTQQSYQSHFTRREERWYCRRRPPVIGATSYPRAGRNGGVAAQA